MLPEYKTAKQKQDTWKCIQHVHKEVRRIMTYIFIWQPVNSMSFFDNNIAAAYTIAL